MFWRRLPVGLTVAMAAWLAGCTTAGVAPTPGPAREAPARVLKGLSLDNVCYAQPEISLPTLTAYAAHSVAEHLNIHPWPDPDCVTAYFATSPSILSGDEPYAVYLSVLREMAADPDCAAVDRPLRRLEGVIGEVQVNSAQAYRRYVPEAAYLKARMLAACGRTDEARLYYLRGRASGIYEADIGLRSLEERQP